MITNLIKLAKLLDNKGNTVASKRVKDLIAQNVPNPLRTNYDYSDESLYHGEMDRFDSVEDFLKQRKKKKKKEPKQKPLT